MHPFPDLRAQVAAQLTALSAPGAPLHHDSDQSTARLFPRGDIGRARFHKNTVDWYVSQANPRLGGRTAIITGHRGTARPTRGSYSPAGHRLLCATQEFTTQEQRSIPSGGIGSHR